MPPGAPAHVSPTIRDNGPVSDLIDTTEMYLRTIFELAEEGILPMRARIAERLSQSGPTVSQTVARMQRDGLVELDQDDRHLVLTDSGADRATRVMRKHRLAECLLIQVIGLPWEDVHNEACRWEHVMSEAVERRLVGLLGQPTVSPFGNPIPGLAQLDPQARTAPAAAGGPTLADAASGEEPQDVVVLRIGETLQGDVDTMALLRAAGAVPGQRVTVVRGAEGIRVSGDGADAALTLAAAAQVVVEAS